MIFNKKIIATLILISVLIIGLQIITPIAAHDTSNAIGSDNFKQNGKLHIILQNIEDMKIIKKIKVYCS